MTNEPNAKMVNSECVQSGESSLLAWGEISIPLLVVVADVGAPCRVPPKLDIDRYRSFSREPLTWRPISKTFRRHPECLERHIICT